MPNEAQKAAEKIIKGFTEFGSVAEITSIIQSAIDAATRELNEENERLRKALDIPPCADRRVLLLLHVDEVESMKSRLATLEAENKTLKDELVGVLYNDYVAGVCLFPDVTVDRLKHLDSKAFEQFEALRTKTGQPIGNIASRLAFLESEVKRYDRPELLGNILPISKAVTNGQHYVISAEIARAAMARIETLEAELREAKEHQTSLAKLLRADHKAELDKWLDHCQRLQADNERKTKALEEASNALKWTVWLFDQKEWKALLKGEANLRYWSRWGDPHEIERMVRAAFQALTPHTEEKTK